jgi:hypothetical protein
VAQLFEIRVIHMIIQDLRSMCEGSGSGGGRDRIHNGPECFHNLAIYHPCSRDIGCCISIKAVVFVAMNVKQPNRVSKLNVIIDSQIRIPFNALL